MKAIRIALLVVIISPALLWLGMRLRRVDSNDTSSLRTTSEDNATLVNLEEIQESVTDFCGACHAEPRPDTFPKDAWFHEVNRGYEFYFQSGRTDLAIPIKQQVYAYYRQQAPKSLNLPLPNPPSDGKLQFRQSEISFPNLSGNQKTPAISHLKWLTPGETPLVAEAALFVTDMRQQHWRDVRFANGTGQLENSLSAGFVAHCEVMDLDQDGMLDFVLADLGSFLPEDHNLGRILWARRTRDGSSYEVVELAVGLGRVADIRPGDFDGDGDIDLVVAEFGWIDTGRILLMENTESTTTHPEFKIRVLDERHGTIHTPVVDLNGDGRLDFVALISQEHEVVESFINDGQGGFQREVIFRANDPSYGSSGIELVDIDADGDMDVLYTNGDMYDSYLIKPHHAVHWIENLGGANWKDRILATLPGVFRALPGDFDGDGDLDIVAVSFIPERVLQDYSGAELDSVVWLEQTASGQFDCRSLETGKTHHAALEVADFDADGDMDFAVGNFHDRVEAALTVWWNETPAMMKK